MADDTSPQNPLLKRANERLAGLRQERYTFWQHWRELADYILPRRYRWLVTPNEARRGAPMNQKILDSTGTTAVRNLASGMMSGITSPTRPWFKLRTSVDDDPQVQIWLAEVERRMMRVFQESNYYNAKAVQYLDLAVFGTAPMLINEDFEDVIRCHNPCAGEYYLATDHRGQVSGFYREFTLTLDQLDTEFGDDMPEELRKALKESGYNAARDVVVCHGIERNDGSYAKAPPKRFPYRELYWIQGQGASSNDFLRVKGYSDKPFTAPRWDVSSNEAYGRSPGMDALPDIKQLQHETKRKAQAIDKHVTPPMLASIELRNQPASLLPGGVTYVSNLSNDKGMRPVYQVQPVVQELMMDIKEIQDRIRVIFFNDLFMMFQQMQAEPRSAAAVDARREEKLIMLGPVLERIQNESLDPDIDRVFGIMQRGKLLPPPPRSLVERGGNIRVEYRSMLAEAQNAAGSAAIERMFAMVGQTVAVDPTAIDIINMDKTLTRYGMDLGMPPDLISTPEELAAKRKARNDMLQNQQALASGVALSQGAKNLSQTDVGGGMNAIQAMTGGNGP